MRVTTQMLNKSAAKAGLPVNRSSLLNYINGNSSNNVSVANALSKTKKAADITKKSDYEKMAETADKAESASNKLLTEGSGNASASDLQTFVERYNELLKSLKSSADTLNKFYAQTAKDTVKEHKEELAALGITAAKDDTLSFDKSVLESDSFDASKVQQLFQKESGFFSKFSFLASRAADNANACAESIAESYTASGLRTNAYLSNGKYNFWT